MKKALIRGLLIGAVFGFAFIVAQVATYTTLAQVPATSAGGALNLFSDFIGLAFNSDSAGTRQWIGPMFAMSKPPLTGWTNDHSGTFDTTYGYPYLDVPRLSATAVGFEYRTAPMGAYVCKALMYWDGSGLPPGTAALGGTATNNGLIVGFRDGTGKIVDMMIDIGGPAEQGIVTDKWTTSTSYSARYKSALFTSLGPGGITNLRNPIWLEWSDDGANLNFLWSIDGNHFRLFDSRGRTDFFASGPTQVGFGGYTNGGDVIAAVPSWNCQ